MSTLYNPPKLSQVGGAMKWCFRNPLTILLLAGLAAAWPGLAADVSPSLKEVQDLIKSNMIDADAGQLERAAVEGLIRQLHPMATLLTNSQDTASAKGPSLAKAWVQDGSFACLRPARVDAPLAGEIDSAMDGLSATNKIKGWVLDLRFVGGTDYKAAATVADRFIAGEHPLLDLGQGVIRSKAKDAPLKAPLVVLVNGQTAEAAEALAAVLRQTDSALLLGTNTAGHAFLTKDCPLKDGQILRLAVAPVKIGEGQLLSKQGVKPDIMVAVNLEDERIWQNNPYKQLGRPVAAVPGSDDEAVALASATNRNLRRINEAELVRMMRNSGDLDLTSLPSKTNEPPRVVRDPALARGLDLLKGLAIVRALRGK